MFARVVTVQTLPGRIEDVMSIFRDSIIPAARQQKGIRGGFLLVDRRTVTAQSVSLWDTEAEMLASETSGFLREQGAKLAPLLAGSPITEHLEVALYDGVAVQALAESEGAGG